MRNERAELVRALIEGAQPRVRQIAAKVAGSQRERVEEFFQIGMTVVCERAPAYTDEPLERFLMLVQRRVFGQMMDIAKAEASERSVRAALERCVERVTVNLEEGDYFDPEEVRAAHRKHAAAAVVAASLFALLVEQQHVDADVQLESHQEQHRIREALESASTSLDPEDRAMVQEVFVHNETFEVVGARRGLTASGAWKRIERALATLHRRIVAELKKA